MGSNQGIAALVPSELTAMSYSRSLESNEQSPLPREGAQHSRSVGMQRSLSSKIGNLRGKTELWRLPLRLIGDDYWGDGVSLRHHDHPPVQLLLAKALLDRCFYDRDSR